ncbi:hypothetical protein BDR22DRAFT_883879 [Usnea florida]
MAPFNVSTFQAILQTAIRPDDHEWVYFVPDLPSSTTIVGNSLIKSISVTSNETLQSMKLRLEKHSPNRGVEDAILDRYMIISFKNFRLQYPSTESEEGAKTKPSPQKESADYVLRLLRSGIILNINSSPEAGTCFFFAASPIALQVLDQWLEPIVAQKDEGYELRTIIARAMEAFTLS